MLKKVSRHRKLKRVLKRKWTKPAIYAIAMSFIIYLILSTVVIDKYRFDKNMPHFVITRLSSEFEETEFMHMLLSVQEINKDERGARELKEFVNKPLYEKCPIYLERLLYNMNWAPQAFLSRMQKLFDMYEIYDRILRLDETVSFLKGEVELHRLPPEIQEQVRIIQKEKNHLLNDELGLKEYEFMKEYSGIIVRLKENMAE